METLYTENCIRTYSGRFLNIKEPSQDDIFPIDIAVGLSRVCRFAGHTKKWYSVADHSLWCMHRAEKLYPADTALPLAMLMHDAHEAYMGDMPTPVAKALGEQFYYLWETAKMRLQRVINLKFGVTYLPALMREIDKDALEYEYEHKVLSWKGFATGPGKDVVDLWLHHFTRVCSSSSSLTLMP